MADYPDLVIPDSQPLPLPEEHEMPKTTVAQLEARVEELEATLSQLLHVNVYQTRALHDVVRRTRNNTQGHRQTNTTRRPVAGKQHKCPNALKNFEHECTGTHTAPEIQELCQQAFAK